MSAKQSEFSFFILCFAVKLQQYYLICLMKITLAFELKKCTSEVPAPFNLISMARLSKQADTSLDYLGFIKNNVTQCPSLAFLLAWFTCTRRERQMHLLGKKNLFEHNIQGFFQFSTFRQWSCLVIPESRRYTNEFPCFWQLLPLNDGDSKYCRHCAWISHELQDCASR